ncbi:hypothetical protein ACH5RR_039602 [Cinchona calisaya]|uniref:Transcription repressor n=1 Tax=Cinchona calisaya TaxID=153742 RepID=A0ABD2Y413_9GENT
MDQHHFANRVSRFFPSSFTSCQFRSVPDVAHSSIPITKTTKILHPDLQPPKPFSQGSKNPSMIKPKEPKNTQENDKKMSQNYPKKSLCLGSAAEGRRCPPVTPVSVIIASTKKERSAKETKIINKSSISSSNSGRWFSSDDEKADQFDGKSDTFFSLSSGSSESFRINTAKCINVKRFDNKMSNELGRCSSTLSTYSVNTALSQCSQKTTKCRRETTGKDNKKWQRREIGNDDFVIHDEILKGCRVSEGSTELYYNYFGSHRRRKTTKPRHKTVKNNHRRSRKGGINFSSGFEDGRVEDSYAVEKSSSDPYNDFRTSIVEMIIEKQIFGVMDLEKLLDCFLSLNSPCHHRVILEVFKEICDTLFAY